MQVIIFKTEFGNVGICNPTGEIPIEQVLLKDVPQNSGARIVDVSTLPADCYDFFDAWEMDGEAVIVNLDKAREITKKRLRIQREPLLEAQDVLFQRALETGESTVAIVSEKQRLRDITQLADAALTLDALRAINC